METTEITKDDIIKAIQSMEEEDFSEFLDSVSEQLEAFVGGEKEASICPESKIEARNWVFAYIKLKEQIEWDEILIKHLVEKYIDPVKRDIEKCERSQEFVKSGLADFLVNAEETKISFPELATVSEAKTPMKIIYPEDEKAFLEKLEKEESEFVIKKSALNKKAMLASYRETKELPHSDLIGENEGRTIRVTISKSRK